MNFQNVLPTPNVDRISWNALLDNRYVFRTHLRFSPARKFKQIGLAAKTGKTRMLHKLQRRQSEFQIKAQIDFPLTFKTNKFQFQLN